jgi:enterochelin esterase family protein
LSINIAGQIPEGAKAAVTNIRTDQCPCILKDMSVLFRVTAPEAGKVQIELGKLYDLKKDEKGIWTGTTEPQVPGFHYYSLVIDGIRVSDPASDSFYGTGRMSSAIEIPEDGADFYKIKDVPHGEIISRIYFSNVTGSWRNMNIYVPAGYNSSVEKFPVLYIMHGGGEDERGWAVQGKTDIILDNLIAEGKAKPMIIVMLNGNVTKPGMTAGGYNDEAMNLFKEELLGSIIPFVESNYRIKADAADRAIAGLSMGGGQSFYTGLRNTEVFGSVGVFSTGLFGGISGQSSFDPEKVIPGLTSNPGSFNKKLKLFYISVGEQDPRIEPTKNIVKTLQGKGLKVEFASFPGAHEWQVWRKSLNDFAQRIFK